MIDSIHLQKAKFFEKYQVYDCLYQISSNGKTFRGYYSNDVGWQLEADTPDCSEDLLENVLDWLWNNYRWDKIERDLSDVHVALISEIEQTNTEINKLISMLNNNPSSDLEHILRKTLKIKYGLDSTSKS